MISSKLRLLTLHSRSSISFQWTFAIFINDEKQHLFPSSYLIFRNLPVFTYRLILNIKYSLWIVHIKLKRFNLKQINILYTFFIVRIQADKNLNLIRVRFNKTLFTWFNTVEERLVLFKYVYIYSISVCSYILYFVWSLSQILIK